MSGVSGTTSGISRPRGIYVALGLLTLCAVFAATAGVREALVTRTQALRQTLAAASRSRRTITASPTATPCHVPWRTRAGASRHNLTAGQISEISGQLHADFDHGAVSLAPASTDWASLTTSAKPGGSPRCPPSQASRSSSRSPYRQPLSQHMRLVAGHFPAAPAPPVPVPGQAGTDAAFGLGSSRFYTRCCQVVVTKQTAATFGLRIGSKVRVPARGVAGERLATITFQVSGIVAPVGPGLAFWTSDQAAALPLAGKPGQLRAAAVLGRRRDRGPGRGRRGARRTSAPAGSPCSGASRSGSARSPGSRRSR